jgi:N-acetylglutamate synthase-like GNAT family acetyltransferase
VEVRAPQTDAEWEAYFELRWRILRAPWQQVGPEREASDATSIHRIVCDANGRVVAVGRLHSVDAATGQIRFMAVDDTEQRRGYGSLLLRALEHSAVELGLAKIILQARENALPFYRHHGYRVEDKTFLLFGEIQHYLMSKPLE